MKYVFGLNLVLDFEMKMNMKLDSNSNQKW